MTFWLRRWIEQSRSNRWTRLPWRVAEDLHLDMAGALHQLLEIDLVLAEGGLGLALGAEDRVEQLVLALDRPHAAPAAAPGRLEHHRIADLGGEPP